MYKMRAAHCIFAIAMAETVDNRRWRQSRAFRGEPLNALNTIANSLSRDEGIVNNGDIPSAGDRMLDDFAEHGYRALLVAGQSEDRQGAEPTAAVYMTTTAAARY